jgi:hypothetical protein
MLRVPLRDCVANRDDVVLEVTARAKRNRASHASVMLLASGICSLVRPSG